MSKHTPGPWEYDGLKTIGSSRRLIGANDGRYLVAECIGNDADANARLIAAAPDYDTAAREMVAAIDHWRASGQPDLGRIQAAQQALTDVIAKVDGAA